MLSVHLDTYTESTDLEPDESAYVLLEVKGGSPGGLRAHFIFSNGGDFWTSVEDLQASVAFLSGQVVAQKEGGQVVAQKEGGRPFVPNSIPFSE